MKVFADTPTTYEFDSELTDKTSDIYKEKSAPIKEFFDERFKQAAKNTGFEHIDSEVTFKESASGRRRRRQAEQIGAGITSFARAEVEGIFR